MVTLRRTLKRLALSVPPIRRLYEQRNALAHELGQARAAPPPADAPAAADAPPPRATVLAQDPKDIPIVINCRDRVESLRRSVDWLLRAGQRSVYLVDNASTYPPLLDYYASVEDRSAVRVVRLGQNFGKKALWEANLLTRLDLKGEFVYTDPDVVPDDSCPPDAVAYFAFVLMSRPWADKIGFGLRLDDIPDTYRFKREVVEWETQFWERPVGRGLYMAPIDTTFALYRPKAAWSLTAGTTIRTGPPYLARHESWYIDSAHPTEEERYYAEHARPGIGYWAVEELATDLAMAIDDLRRQPRRTRLNLGCGRQIIPGWINLDSVPGPGVDVVGDLDACARIPLDLPDDSVDEFLLCHVLEHIRHPLPLFAELYRIARPDARATIFLPHGAHNEAFEDPTHVRQYFEHSFLYFGQPAYSRADYGYRGDWEPVRVTLAVPRAPYAAMAREQVLDRIARERNVVLEMQVELMAVKPARPPRSELLVPPPVELEFR